MDSVLKELFTALKAKFETVPIEKLSPSLKAAAEIIAPGTLRTSESVISPVTRILFVTTEAALSLSRVMVLERAGFSVVSAGSLLQVSAALESQSFSIFLVGHALPRIEKERILASLRQRSPSVPIVELHSPGASAIAGADCVIETGEGPAALINSIRMIARATKRKI